MELIDLVNSVIIFLSQMTLLRWLTFLPESLTVTLTVLLFWIYSFFLTLVFARLGNSDYVVFSVSIDFPKDSKRDVPFHRILPSGAYVTRYMRGCSHYEMRENKRHSSCGFP